MQGMHGPWKPNAIAPVLSTEREDGALHVTAMQHRPFNTRQDEKETESSGDWCVLPLHVAMPAADVHQTGDLPVPLPTCVMGGQISGTASRLDALSVYPGRGRLSGGATGVTTGQP